MYKGFLKTYEVLYAILLALPPQSWRHVTATKKNNNLTPFEMQNGDCPAEEREQPLQECHNKVTQLTYSKSNNTTEEGENPECRRKSRHQMNYTANKTTKEKRPLPAKLVRKGTHNNTANEKTGEDD